MKLFLYKVAGAIAGFTLGAVVGITGLVLYIFGSVDPDLDAELDSWDWDLTDERQRQSIIARDIAADNPDAYAPPGAWPRADLPGETLFWPTNQFRHGLDDPSRDEAWWASLYATDDES